MRGLSVLAFVVVGTGKKWLVEIDSPHIEDGQIDTSYIEDGHIDTSHIEDGQDYR